MVQDAKGDSEKAGSCNDEAFETSHFHDNGTENAAGNDGGKATRLSEQNVSGRSSSLPVKRRNPSSAEDALVEGDDEDGV